MNGEIDIGFIRPPVRHTLEDMNVLKLYEEPLMVAVHIDHSKFTKEEKVYLKDLKMSICSYTLCGKRGLKLFGGKSVSSCRIYSTKSPNSVS